MRANHENGTPGNRISVLGIGPIGRKGPPIPTFGVTDFEQSTLTLDDAAEGFLMQETNGANDDDHSLSSLGTSSSEESGDDISESSFDDDKAEDDNNMLQRRRENQEKHAQFLEALHEKYKDQIPRQLKTSNGAGRKRKYKQVMQEIQDAKDHSIGMLRNFRSSLEEDDSHLSLSDRIASLSERYPSREQQIRRLAALLHGSMGACRSQQSPASMVHVSPPIMVTGPSGSGKSSVVMDLIHVLKYEAEDKLHSAHVDCSSVEPCSIERLVTEAYKQLCMGISKTDTNRRRRPKRRKTTNLKVPFSPKSKSSQLADSKENEQDLEYETAGQKKELVSSLKTQSDDGMEFETEHRLRPRREVVDYKEVVAVATSALKKRPRRPSVPVPTSMALTENDSNHSEDAVETSHSAVVSFGRSMQRHFGCGSQRQAVLVLEKAERLLSISARKKSDEKTNCLAELMLLSKVMKLNLTVVAISTYSLLSATRLDNIASHSVSSATLGGSVGPVLIQFPGYKDGETITKILKSKQVLPRIFGSKTMTPFAEKAASGFLSALVQLLSDTTGDINEYIRIGRSLWPIYTKPLHTDSIVKTLSVCGSASNCEPNEEIDSQVLGLLGKRFMGAVGKMSMVLGDLAIDSQWNAGSAMEIPRRPPKVSDLKIPFLRSCLLLAAFICQHNRAENDKKVFSVHGNGKRRRTRKGNQSGGNDDAAFASTTGGTNPEHLKSLRPRPFQVERVFSIFITLVRLNPGMAPVSARGMRLEFDVHDLGASTVYDDFAGLMDLGFIHLIQSHGDVRGEQINLNGARYWCSLTYDEATDLAGSYGIPLDSYLV